MIVKAKLFDGILISAGIPKEKIRPCLEWAAGDDIDSLDISEFFARWNEKHASLFVFKDGNETFDSALARIANIYLAKNFFPQPLATINEDSFRKL